MDHTYPPEKFLPHLGARVNFQLGPQLLDIQSNLTWHSGRMFFPYCSLTGTASNWYDRFDQVYKNDWSSCLQVSKKQSYSLIHACHSQLEALSIVKKDKNNVKHYGSKVETRVEQGWYNKYPSTMNIKSNENFTRGLPEQLKVFANKRKVKPISAQLNIPFRSTLLLTWLTLKV